jgi:hypothetical protein
MARTQHFRGRKRISKHTKIITFTDELAEDFRLGAYTKLGSSWEPIPPNPQDYNIMPRTKQNIPANENNAQRFVRVANHRVNTILVSLKALGQLGTAQYESKPEQRKRIEDAIKSGLEKAMSAMQKGEGVQEFKL